ncbi:unnamed protein product, partial [marine sediment metagenome]
MSGASLHPDAIPNARAIHLGARNDGMDREALGFLRI